MFKNLFIASPFKKGMETVVVKGIWETKQVFLNGQELSIDKSIEVKCLSSMFGWGYNSYGGSRQLAVAVLNECVGETLAKKQYYNLSRKFFDSVTDKDFEIPIDIREFLNNQNS